MNQKTLFLHIPRTAGSSILDKLRPNFDAAIHAGAKPPPAGTHEMMVRDKLLDHFKVGFVRNPWDRYVSLYHYFYQMTPYHYAYSYDKNTVKIVQQFKTFKDFCIHFNSLNHKKFHFFPQVSWSHHHKTCILDFIGRFENLEEDVYKLQDILQVDNEALGQIPNASNHKHYTEYYDDETRKIVSDIYALDIEYFNYTYNDS